MDRLTAMQVFADVAQSGSFTATADKLDMSRAMVTRYIAQMENWLGVRLLHRTTRRVTLTDAGEQALRRSLQMLALAQDVQDETARQDGELRGQLRLTNSLSFGYAQLAAAVTDFLALHPQLKIDLNVGDATLNLIEARIDLAIRITSEPDPMLIGRPLARCDSLLVASPAYLAIHDTPRAPDELRHHRCLAYANFGRSTWRLSRGVEQVDVAVMTPLSSNDALVLSQAALADGGVAMLPTYLANPYLRSGALQVILPDWRVPELTIYALYPSRRQRLPSVRMLLDFLAQRFERQPWSFETT